MRVLANDRNDGLGAYSIIWPKAEVPEPQPATNAAASMKTEGESRDGDLFDMARMISHRAYARRRFKGSSSII